VLLLRTPWFSDLAVPCVQLSCVLARAGNALCHPQTRSLPFEQL
jgi:hypothetical protein